MADDSFVDSPWVQLGVPLAAVAASAIAPRHAGRVSALGLNAFQGINQYRYGQQRLSQLNAQNAQDQQEAQDFDKNFKSLMEQDEPTAHKSAPEGGDGPEAVSTSGAQQMDQGGGPPKIHGPRIHSEQKQELGVMYQLVGHDRDGRRAIAKRLSDMLEANTHPTLEAIQGVDQSKMNVDTYSGKTNLGDSFTLKRPEAPKPQTAEQAYGSMESSPGLVEEAGQRLRGEQQIKSPETYAFERADSGVPYKFGNKSGQLSPVEMAGQPSPRLSQTGQQQPAPQQQMGSPTPQSAGVAPRPASQQRQGGAPTFGIKPKEVSPEKLRAREAMDEWIADPRHKGASKIEIQQASVFAQKGIRTDDLDAISDMLWKGDPDALLSADSAFGRGSEVRAYVNGRAARLAAENGVQFNPELNKRKAKMLMSFSDLSRGPGRSLVAMGTAMRHIDGAIKAVQDMGDAGPPILNQKVNEFLINAAGSPMAARLQTAYSVVPYEYMTMLKNGMALTDKDTQEADKLVPLGLTVGQALATFKEMGHIMVERGNEMNHAFKQTIGKDINEAISPEAAAVLDELGVGQIGGQRSQGQKQYQKTATDAQGNKVGFDGTSWVPIPK